MSSPRPRRPGGPGRPPQPHPALPPTTLNDVWAASPNGATNPTPTRPPLSWTCPHCGGWQSLTPGEPPKCVRFTLGNGAVLTEYCPRCWDDLRAEMAERRELNETVTTLAEQLVQARNELTAIKRRQGDWDAGAWDDGSGSVES